MAEERARTDEGFGLVEVVVSMLLLAIIAAAFLPVLAGTVLQSAKNVTITSATQTVNDQLERARNATPTCTALTAFKNETIQATVDSRAVPVQASRTMGTCPASYPGTVLFTATVTRTDTGEVLATAKTYIYLSGA